MKKKEDLKRRLKGEKTGLKTGRWISFSLFLFLIFPGIVSSQIPVNGFCVKNSYQIPYEYKKLTPADINKDQKDELILYSPDVKKIGLFSFGSDGFRDLIEYPADFGFSQISYLKDLHRFICVSRKNRLIAIYEFSLTSPPVFISRFNFDSFPENVFAADINLDGKLEVLISGIGFDGLSVLFRKAGRIAERKIVIGGSYSDAFFTDLTNDGFPDIAAANVINNSIQFFFNDTKGNFREERKIVPMGKIENFNSFDVNGDGFNDIVFTSGTDLNIIFGDFQSGYENKKIIPLKHKPDAVRFGDYNRDQIPDIAYINNKTGNLNIIPGKDNNEYWDEINYTNIRGISSIVNYKEKNFLNLSLLGEDGQLSTISSLRPGVMKTDLVPSVSPDVLRKFDYNNDSISDLCFIDKSDNTFRLMLRDKDGIPSAFFLYPLAGSHQKIHVDEFYKMRKTFYCYSEDSHLIESLRINFRTNKLNHQQLYSPGKIKDLAIQRVDSSRVNIYLLYEKSNKLYLGRFEHRDLSISFREYPFIDRDVITARLFLNEEITAFYWKVKNDSVFFNRVIIKEGANEYRGIIGLSKTDSAGISLFASNDSGKNNPLLLSIIRNENMKFLITVNGNDFILTPTSGEESEFVHLTEAQVSFGVLKDGESESILIYNTKSNALKKLIISQDGKSFMLEKIIEAENADNYFIDKFNLKNYHLVYSNKKKGCISVIPLKK